MIIRMLRPAFNANGVLMAAGTTQDLSDTLSWQLISDGAAELVGPRAASGTTGPVATWADAAGTALVRPDGLTVSVGGSGGSGDLNFWQPNTTYNSTSTTPIADVVLVPNGKGLVATCYETHTSGASFDATKWVFPSDDGTACFQFHQLAHLPVGREIFPTKGRLASVGCNPSSQDPFLAVLQDEDGGYSLQPTPLSVGGSFPNFYFTLGLPDPDMVVQHMWVVFRVTSTVAAAQGMTVLFLRPGFGIEFGNGINAGVHNGFLFSSRAWGIDSFGVSGTGAGNLGQTQPMLTTELAAERIVRLDITINKVTGLVSQYVNGRLNNSHLSTTSKDFISDRCAVQFPGIAGQERCGFAVREFGISQFLPQFDTNRGTQLDVVKQSVFTTVTAITTAGDQKAWEMNIEYGATGAVEVSIAFYLSCTSGTVDAILKTANNTNANPFWSRLMTGPDEGRVFFSQIRQGTPFTRENIGIYVRASSGGTSAIAADTVNGTTGGPRWKHIKLE